MESKVRRSSLRKSVAGDAVSGDIKSAQKRRISFNIKKSVRVFSGEEEPKAWNNSFEISDHLNVNETAKNVCAVSKIKDLQSSKTISHDNKENIIARAENLQKVSCRLQGNVGNSSITNISDQRLTNDFINASDQITRSCRIENSIDITLIEHEKYFQKEVTGSDQISSNLLSFSLEDNERKSQFGEKTCDFMRDLKNGSYVQEEIMKFYDSSSKKEFPNQYSASSKNKSARDSVASGTADSLSAKSNQEICSQNDAKRKSVYEASAMQLSLNEVNKPMQNANETQNTSCQMEIEDIVLNPEINEDSNKNKLRSTIYLDERIEISRVTTTMQLSNKKLTEKIENKKNRIYFNQIVDTDTNTAATSVPKKRGAIPKSKSSSMALNQTLEISPISLSTKLLRKTMNLNEDMDTTSHASLPKDAVPAPCSLTTNLYRRTVNLTEDMDTTSHGKLSKDSVPCPTDLDNKLSRRTVNLDEDMDTNVTKNSVACSSGLGTKSHRKTMKLNEDIETTSHASQSKDSVPCPSSLGNNLYRRTMNLNEDMDTTLLGKVSKDPVTASNNLESKLCRKTMNLNEDMDTTLHAPLSPQAARHPISLGTELSRRTVNLNEDMDTMSHGKMTEDSVPFPNSLGTKLCRKTMNLNEDMETTLPGVESNAPVTGSAILATNSPRKTMNLNEDMDSTFSQDAVHHPTSFSTNLCRKTVHLNADTDKKDKSLNISASSRNIRKSQPSKIALRKICLPTPTGKKSLFDSQQRLLRLKKEEQQQRDLNVDSETHHSAAILVDKDERRKVNKLLNFSMESLKNFSLSSDSSSPLIPLEFKGYTLKQLNDEIESGRIKVFPNAQRTPIVIRKRSDIQCAFQPNTESVSKSSVAEKNSIPLEDVGQATTCTKAKYRYSQADEVMLDNTSFLARAKLSDETMSQKSSKRDSTQFGDTIDIFDETFSEAADQPQDDDIKSSLKTKHMCNPDKNQKTLPPAETDRNNRDNLMSTSDMMDISNNSEHAYKNDALDLKNPLLQRTKECQKSATQIQLFQANKENIPVQVSDNFCNQIGYKNIALANARLEETSGHSMSLKAKIPKESIEQEDKLLERNTNLESSNLNPTRKTIYCNEESIVEDTDFGRNADVASGSFKPSRKTSYFNTDISFHVDTERNVQCEESKAFNSQNVNRRTVLVTTNIQEESILSDKTGARVENANNDSKNLIRTGKTLYYNTDAPLEKETTSKYPANLQNEEFIINSKTCAKESLSEAEGNEQRDFTDNKVSLAKSTRKTLFFEADMQEESALRENIVNPSRRTVYYNNNISLQNTNAEVAENEQPNLYTNPSRRTLFFETKIDEDSILENGNNLRGWKSEAASCNSILAGKTRSLNKCEPSVGQKNNTSNMLKASDTFKENEHSEFTETEKPVRKTIYFETNIQEDSMVANANSNLSSPSTKALVNMREISLEHLNAGTGMNVEDEYSKQYVTQNPSRRTLFFETNMQEETISQQNEGHNCEMNIELPICTTKTLHYNSEITPEKQITTEGQTKIPSEKSIDNKKSLSKENSVEIEEKEQTGLTETNPLEKPQLSKTTNEEIVAVVNANEEPLRRTLYYNCEIPLENTLAEVSNNSPPQEKEKSKALKNVAEKQALQMPQPNAAQTNNVCREIIDLTTDHLELQNNCNAYKTSTFQSELPARRSVYTPENMDLTLSGEVLQENEINDDSGKKMADILADGTKHQREKLLTESNHIYESKDCNDAAENDQSFKPGETYQFPEPVASLNAAKMSLSRRLAKIDFVTPKKSAGLRKNFALCITPRLSLLEFERLEKEEGAERENKCKRLAFNLTPILSVTKKQHTLNFDACLAADGEVARDNEEPQLLDDANDVSMLSAVDANESAVKTPLKEKKSRIPIPISSSSKMQQSHSFIEADNVIQKENDSQLETGNDHFTESIQLMRRATTFAHLEDTISDQYATLHPAPKLSVFEGNPITISDVSVFFEAQRKSNIDASKSEVDLPLEKSNTFVLQPVEKPKNNLENRFINLTIEDIDKTHLSLVRGDEYDDDDEDDIDDAACVNDLQKDDQDIIESGKNTNALHMNRNESLVCRKCKRCQETFVNETTSSVSESFVMPELPPLPDLGMERLRRLRQRPSLTDVNTLWQRVSLDRTIYSNADTGMETIFDFANETEDHSSAVTTFIRTFYEDMKSFEAKLLENHSSTISPVKLPYVLRLEDLLRKNCPNWIFDYQSQFRGILIFTHKKAYTFTLAVRFENLDLLGHEINVKSIQVEKGQVPKKNWKPIDFVFEFGFKLNLPFNLQSLCKGSSESDMIQMLQEVDRICLATVRMTKELQLICFSNQASILCYTGGSGTYVRKYFRQIVDRPNTEYKMVKKTEIQVELLNLEKLSFKDITFPQLHHFREEVHLLPTGLQFLREFLPNALHYLKDS